MKEKNKSSLLKITGICFVFFFIQCNQSNFYEETVDLESNWSAKKPATFSFKLEKQKAKKIYLLLRNNDDYEFSNIYLFVHQTNPNGKKEIDTLQYFLAKPSGEWMGSGMTEIKQNFLELKALKAYKKGAYKIEVFQGMRKNKLKGIEDITLVIE